MPLLTDARNSNSLFNPSYVPVMVITGATAGIGQAMAEAIYEDGDSTFEFVQCDLTLMKNVHAVAKDFNQRLTKINLLVHCASMVGFGGRKETEEGIDEKLALRYYARWALTCDLLPLLRAAKDQGELASVMSVLGAGLNPEIDLDDLGLKKTYKGLKAMSESTAYNDLMTAEFADREPEIAFTHIYPGLVYTGTISNKSIITRILVIPILPLLWLLTTPQTYCAQYMLFALLNAKKGMNRCDPKGDDIGMKKFPQAEGAQKLLWDHSLEATTIDT